MRSLVLVAYIFKDPLSGVTEDKDCAEDSTRPGEWVERQSRLVDAIHQRAAANARKRKAGATPLAEPTFEPGPTSGPTSQPAH